MTCGNCEEEGVRFEWGRLGRRYCDLACARKHHRDSVLPFIQGTIKILNNRSSYMDEKSHEKDLEKFGDCSLVEMAKHKPMVSSKTKKDVDSSKCGPWLATFTTYRKQFEFYKQENKVKLLKLRTLIAVDDRNGKMYPLYKAKLLEEWAELLNLCERDWHAVAEAKQMTNFAKLFDFEAAFF